MIEVVVPTEIIEKQSKNGKTFFIVKTLEDASYYLWDTKIADELEVGGVYSFEV